MSTKKATFPGFRELAPNSSTTRPLDSEPIDCPDNIGELLNRYEQEVCDQQQEQEFRSLQSVFVKIIVPALEGPKPRGTRASSVEIEAARKFLYGISTRWLESALSGLDDIFKQIGIEPTNQHKPRSYIKKLVTWAKEKGFIYQSDRKIIYRFKEVTKSRAYIEDITLMKGRPSWKDRCRLGSFEQDYIQDDEDENVPLESSSVPFSTYWRHCLPFLLSFPRLLLSPRLHLGVCWVQLMEIEKPWVLANRKLEEQLAEYTNFAFNRLVHREPTVNRDIETHLRYLGWLHREQKVPLNQLRLDSIISLIELKPNRDLFKDENGVLDRDKFRLAKMIAIEDMEEETDELLDKLDDYFGSCQTSPAAAVNYMKSFINLAKKVYATQTKKFKLERGFEDIPLVESLRDKQAEYDQQHKAKNEVVIPRSARLIPWTQVLEVVEKSRQEFEQTHRFHVRHTRQLTSGDMPIEKIPRTDWARARNLQWFLMLAIMTANPPRRPRVYRELEVGRTLVKGSFIHGVFVPASELIQSAKAEWWIHLMPGDYKTGAKYGEWWGKLTNTTFFDGKTLYDYIDEWLTTWRPIFAPDHNHLFTQLKGDIISGSDFRQRIERLFCRFTGVPVNPHSLRHIYITYLKSIHASDAELESAAAAMGHSRETQSRIYDLMTLQDKLALSLELTRRIGENFYSNYEVISS